MSLRSKFNESFKSKYDKLENLFCYCQSEGRLTLKEINMARKLLIKHDQQIYFGQLIRSIQIKARNELRESLGVIINNNLLRCERRYSKMNLYENAKCPVLMSHKSSIFKLLVQHAHGRVLHSGVKSKIKE